MVSAYLSFQFFVTGWGDTAQLNQSGDYWMVVIILGAVSKLFVTISRCTDGDTRVLQLLPLISFLLVADLPTESKVLARGHR